jgi:hypothetical protein
MLVPATATLARRGDWSRTFRSDRPYGDRGDRYRQKCLGPASQFAGSLPL